jgi:hypothetical protein
MNSIVSRSVLHTVGTLLLGAAFVLCVQGEEAPKTVIVTPTTPEQLDVQRTGEAAIDRLAVSMTNEVRSALRGGDPTDALDFCHLKALPTTPGQMISGMPRIIAIKFTSLKIRSKENLPDATDKLVLDYIDQSLKTGNAAPGVIVQRIDLPYSPPEWRVYKPIGVSSSCLACHGDPEDQSPRLRSKLKAMYPNDESTGYKSREWRGVIRVTVADGPAQ